MRRRGVPFGFLLGALLFGAICLCMGLAFGAHVRFVEKNALDQVRTHAESQSQSIALLLQPDVISGFYPAIIHRASRTLELQPEIVGMSVLMRNGYEVFDKRKETAAEMESLQVEARVLLSAQTDPEEWAAVVNIRFSLERHRALMRQQRQAIALVAAALLLAALGVSTAVSIALSRPIRTLAEAMKQGDLVRLSEVNSPGAEAIAELGDLFAQTRTLAAQNLEFQAELVKRTKEAALAEQAQQVAHDIRSPLVALEAAYGAIKGVAEEERVLLRAAVLRIREIAESLLSRGTPPAHESSPDRAPKAMLLAPLVDAAVAEKRLQLGPHSIITVSTRAESSARGAFVRVESVELKRALSNLLNNAIEAIPEHGSVLVSQVLSNGRIVLAIKDEGQGIPPKVLAGLGRRGVTHGKAKGSGLGLFHAKSVIESWGGRLEIESELGKGTTVRLILPHVEPPSITQVESASAAVLIDDDPLVRMNWTLAAKRAGKTLKAYSDAPSFINEAGETAKDAPVYIDSDLGEGAKGEEAAKEIHALGFTELFLATGHDPASFPPLPHIKGIQGKEPPWPTA